ncbi:unknown [Eubacterium sp. CAG:603]|jgi:hypothetical protein|nr:unknown [Eubacterium sp. CAG:603]
MEKDSFAQGIISILIIIGILFLTNVIAGPTNAKCSKLGCDNDRVSGSDYCYLHKSSGSKNYTYGSSTYGKSSYSTKSTNSKSNYTKSNSGSSSNSYSSNSYKNNNSSYSYTKKNNTTKENTQYPYDEGYNDYHYDYDRYDRDISYARGVEDAMDDLEYEYRYYKNK